MVTGIQTFRTSVGEPFVTIRGVRFPFNAGNVKLLVNSTSMTRETSSVNPSVMLLPIEQVDRIEVVRGPSSSVYGDFAFLGVITSSHKNLAAWTSNDGEEGVQNTADESRFSGIAELSRGSTSLSYQAFDRDYETNVVLRERQQSIDARHYAELPGAWYADADISLLITDVDMPGGVFEGDMVRSQIGSAFGGACDGWHSSTTWRGWARRWKKPSQLTWQTSQQTPAAPA